MGLEREALRRTAWVAMVGLAVATATYSCSDDDETGGTGGTTASGTGGSTSGSGG